MKKAIIFCIILIGLIIGGFSNTIYSRENRILYVDNTLTADCLNSNGKHYEPSLPRGGGCINGLGTQAYNTLQKAANVVIPGDEVLVRGGTYLANLVIRRSGTATDRITFKNYPGEIPIIDGQFQGSYGIGIGLADITANQGHYITVEGFTVKDTDSSQPGIKATGTRDLILRKNHVYQSGYTELITNNLHLTKGISLAGPNENAIIEYNHVHHLSIGIELRHSSNYATDSVNTIIRYNHVHHIGIECTETDYIGCLNDQNSAHGMPIANGAIDTTVYGNVNHHNQDGNLNTNENGPGYNVFRDNILYLANYQGSAGANGYGLKFKPTGTQSNNNDYAYGNIIFIGFGGTGTATGLIANVFDGNGAKIYHNLVMKTDNGFSGSQLSGNQATYVKNSAFFNNNIKDLGYNALIPGISDYNYVEDGIFQSPALNPNTLTGAQVDYTTQFNNIRLLDIDSDSDRTPDILEPLNYPNCQSSQCFVDAEDAYNYAVATIQSIFGLKSTSVFIDAGTYIPGYHCPASGPDSSGCREWYGNAPDIGPIEFNSGNYATTTSTSSTTSSSTRPTSITSTTTSSTSTSTSALSCYDYNDLPSCVTSLCVNNQNVFLFDNSSCDDRDKCTIDVCTRIGCRYSINYTDLSCSTIDFGCKDKDNDGLYEHDSKTCPIGADVCEEKKQDISFDELNNLRPRSSILNIDFNGSDYREISNFRIFKEKKAEIKFKEKLDLVNINESGCFVSLNIDNLVEIKDKKVVIYSEDYSGFNKPALITFYNVNFKDPKIKKDGALCNELDCKIISYDQTGKMLIVEVKGFSEYLVVEGSASNGAGDNSGGSSSSFKDTKIIEQIICKENWSCGKFGECINGKQIRICTDESKCGAINNKPNGERGCYGELIDNLFIKTENSGFNNLFSKDNKKMSTGTTILVSFIIVDIILFLIVYFVLIKPRMY